MTTTQAGLPRYDDAVAGFRIEDEIARLQGDPATGINAYVECCGRHTGQNRLALRAISAGGELSEFTFEDLDAMSGRVGNLLKGLGVGPGDVVAGMLPRIPELVALILGVWRIGAVYQPLFTAFGPKAIEHRLEYSAAKVVVTNPANRGKLDEVANLPRIATILGADDALRQGDIDFRAALAAASPACEPVMRRGRDLFMMMSTSGTTGLPKGVPVPLSALMAFGAYMRDAIGLRPDDIFWNIADPGWAYGLYYAITGPLLLGIATTFNEGAFTARTTYDVILRLGVTSLAGSPTAFRLLLAEGPDAAARIKGRLRVVSSAGEPLNPEVIRWFDAHLDAPIHDHYGQTENGMMVNNHHGLAHPVRAGSAGFAMPGYRMVVLDEAGNELGPNQPGILAVDIANSPLRWFGGYHQAETPAISGGYYRTGDTVEYEPDGSVSFIGRADDVITSSGYRIGPFDVESALIEHPAVTEAAVVGVPDPQRTEIVKAFVILAPAYKGSPELAEELALHVRKRLSAHAYPREVEFVTELPKTPSGKIQRFLLRKAEVEKRKG
ncbi:MULTISPECIES: acyl-CoA synthetase [unclassified Mesorhizobium]|uniref:acyl-CoA synthetase n=1 Tax=unclassified Mesorhizobium TaxID=325217 RepID=UPI000FDC9E73|nr:MULTISPECIES: acyl-CoA synthetase [unclassified Mesorhizobium]TGR47243.1 AMP-binding protein [bacterium M00.F.Ca.ET.199.01.1.1]TGU36694.1 AMP-binding protein [bacterium M00.F.Ca.ET.156.01.1.1]TGV08552.1 AMP-binding protein [Mesorhizobium sp. M8A.F.Ca.ET.173.01.1.1]TGV87881.1 AMP-binding protein [Mesorhizobium sp. M00.F.Ca.ET.149.01.1.1]TGR28956.1 AMP-binding protein [Mesorhizobium sp. M8A.F.Ca.ET.202.01.1.1]